MSRTAAIVVCALFAVIGSVTCSPFDTTEASIGSGSDAGPIWTTSDGGTPDGGTGSSDGGTATSDGGGGGVGTGGGAGGGASAACEGIVPGSNPPQQSAVIPHGSGQVCWFFASDEAGNVAAESHSGSDFSNVEWKFWAPGGGGVTGTARAGVDLFGEPSGFESTHRESGSTYLVRWSGSGAEQNRTLLGGPGCNGEAFLSLQKGSLVLGGCSGGALMASIFDVDGKLVASRAIADRFTNAVGAVDSNGSQVGGTVDAIRGTLSINGQGGNDALTLEDSSDTSADTVTVNDMQVGLPGETIAIRSGDVDADNRAMDRGLPSWEATRPASLLRRSGSRRTRSTTS